MALTLPPEASQRLCIIRPAKVFTSTMEHVLVHLANYRHGVKNGCFLCAAIYFLSAATGVYLCFSGQQRECSCLYSYSALVLVDGIGFLV